MAEEAKLQGLTRKKRVRGGHRASANRTIAQMYEAKESADDRESVLTKLMQCKLSLQGKLDTVRQLDDEILELVDDADVDDEIEQADIFNEKLQVAIIDVTAAIEARRTGRAPSPRSLTVGTTTASLTVASSTEVPSASTVSTSATTVTSDTLTEAVSVSSSSATAPVISPSELHTDSALTTSTSGTSSGSSAIATSTLPIELTLPVLPTSTVFSTPSLCPPGATTFLTSSGISFGDSPHYPGALAVHPPTAMAVDHVINVKLPKLSLKKFNGEVTKWSTFWDAFESSVHNNPGLSAFDKFNYLKSLLEGPASEAVSGLKLTAVNYVEAVSILKKRFGNKQQIISKHMENLLGIDVITSQHNLKGLRHLYDTVESQVRGLRSLGVPAASYGSLLSSILMSKLPQELRLIVSREVQDEEWELERLMRIIEREVEARERASTANQAPRRFHKEPLTGTSLLAGGSTMPKCSYCRQNHPSASCRTVSDVAARRQILRKTGRCFVCLRKNHMSRECRSNMRCSHCEGRHHISICSGSSASDTRTPVTGDNQQERPLGQRQGTATNLAETTTPTTEATPTTSALHCVTTRVPVLLQTARAMVFKINDVRMRTEARIMFDNGSQRSYITKELAETLSLNSRHTETMVIRTFGSRSEIKQVCELVSLGVTLRDGRSLQLSFLTVPFICEPLTSQPIMYAKENYDRLTELDLADCACEDDRLTVDILVGSDNYWKLVTGEIINGDSGPTAIKTRLGWVLTGPVEGISGHNSTNLVVTHTMAVDTHVSEDSDQELDRKLKMFWDLESLGIQSNEATVYDEFESSIQFNGERYEVSLPWKESHAPLPDNYDLSLKRLVGLLKRLRQNPKVLHQYDTVIRQQIQRGIVEFVDTRACTRNLVHYLPHHAVLREDKATTKLRIVYDASSKTCGPSLNDCLYTGPKSGQKIMDILLRFRIHRVAMAADIEKAFLMISVQEEDRDVLRFLWVKDLKDDVPDVTVLRFTRVVFGVSASPFLLNATIKHHVEQYSAEYPELTSLFMRSIYVDDVSFGADDEESAFELYTKSKEILSKGGFNLHKFVTNSTLLSHRVELKEQDIEASKHNEPKVVEEDKSYTKDVLGCKQHIDGEQKILGVKWNFVQDTLVFDLNELVNVMRSLKATKRQIVGIATRLYDPLGFIAPVIIRIKMFFQELCVNKIEWDEPLTGQLLSKWNTLLSSFKGIVTSILRCYFWSATGSSKGCSLHGFCDASLGAYAAVVYVRIETVSGTSSVSFVASKTRVAPVNKQTIPRLELLSALLLSNLITTVTAALREDVQIDSVTCYTDSRVSLYWIKGLTKEWKLFVQNRVNTIRRLVPSDQWKHCAGDDNPADLPSRGVTSTDLVGSVLWRYGPSWLTQMEPCDEDELVMPEECIKEMKASSLHVMVVTTDPHSIGKVINCTQFSSLCRLLRVTAYVMRFYRLLKAKVQGLSSGLSAELSASEIEAAETLWVKEAQLCLREDDRFKSWEHQFGLFLMDGVWRCKGRLGNADIPYPTRYPALLTKEHHLSILIVKDAHRRVMHNGVKETLTEIRSKYWIVKGRQFVRQVINKCVVCRKFEGHPYTLPPPPPLPEFRIKELPPFSYTGVDFAGPLYVRTQGLINTKKVWICLYTCCVVRAVHLELVPDLTADSFLRCFKRFTARRGIPHKMISENGKTFKAAAKAIYTLSSHHDVQGYSANIGVEWSFNLEKAPWWGGIFERMIKSAKRCLRKTIGRARMTYDELLTAVTEAEMIINSRPLSYVSTEDIEEPLTPSHLLVGHRVLSLPDPSCTCGKHSIDVSQETLSKRAKHLGKIMEHFWKRWRAEYLLQLRECHRYSMGARSMPQHGLNQGDVVLVHNDKHLRGFWKLARIERLLEGPDKQIRGAVIRIPSRSSSTILRRPLNCFHPLEITCQALNKDDTDDDRSSEVRDTQAGGDVASTSRPRRAAAQRARDWMKTVASHL